jgi:hypothetical protein
MPKFPIPSAWEIMGAFGSQEVQVGS